MRYQYLMFADANANHNKFYEMTENDDRSIDVKYGRVGTAGAYCHYGIGEKNFDTLFRQKIGKGYTDVTQYHAENDIRQSKFKIYDDYEKIDNSRIDKFVRQMFERQQRIVQTNYRRPTDATPEMVQKAKDLVYELKKISNQHDRNNMFKNDNYYDDGLWDFNHTLNKLFTVIPRVMSDVSSYIAKSVNEYDKIIDREQNLIDALENVLKQRVPASPTTTTPSHNQTILEANGLTVKPITYKEEDRVIAKLKDNDKNQNRFLRAIAITNEKTNSLFEDYMSKQHGSHKHTELLWHGSPNKNWWSIATNGLDVKFSNNGMFGHGIYFAPKSGKSAGYMSTGSYWRGGNDSSGYLALFEVATGKSETPVSINGMTTSSALTYLKNKGYDSIWAKSGNTRGFHLCNDEVIVYRNEQQTIRYLVEISDRARNFTVDITKDFFTKPIDKITKIENGISCSVGEIKNGYLTLNDPKRYTHDDLWFISREIKKQFFESEEQYQEFVETKENGFNLFNQNKEELFTEELDDEEMELG